MLLPETAKAYTSPVPKRPKPTLEPGHGTAMRVPPDVAENLRLISKATGLTKRVEIVRAALRCYIERMLPPKR